MLLAEGFGFAIAIGICLDFHPARLVLHQAFDDCMQKNTVVFYGVTVNIDYASLDKGTFLHVV